LYSGRQVDKHREEETRARGDTGRFPRGSNNPAERANQNGEKVYEV